jgi:ribosome-associated translation inhibitor RaiA
LSEFSTKPHIQGFVKDWSPTQPVSLEIKTHNVKYSIADIQALFFSMMKKFQESQDMFQESQNKRMDKFEKRLDKMKKKFQENDSVMKELQEKCDKLTGQLEL